MTDEKTAPDGQDSAAPTTDSQGERPATENQESPPVPLSKPVPGSQTGRRPLFRG